MKNIKRLISLLCSVLFCFSPAGAFWDTVEVSDINTNSAPEVKAVSGETFANVMIELPLSVTDKDGDAVLLKLIDLPKLGTASITGNSLQYTPLDGKTGTDKFSYAAIDTFGNQSEPAEIKIKINKNKSKVTYSDMVDDPAQYAAITLAQEGIMTGTKIGTAYFFSPDENVSRSEFIAMAAAASGLDIKETSQTDFIDDSGLSDWVKPYVSAAAANGLISGYQTASGGCELRGENPITLAEACVILSNMLEDSTSVVQTAAIDTDYAPVWAQSACAVLTASNILPDEVTAESSTAPITRATACELLYRTMQEL